MIVLSQWLATDTKGVSLKFFLWMNTCNNEWRVGGVLNSNKEPLVQNIALVVTKIEIYISLKLWEQLDLDERYWKYLIQGIINALRTPLGPHPSPNIKISQPPSPPYPLRPSQSTPT